MAKTAKQTAKSAASSTAADTRIDFPLHALQEAHAKSLRFKAKDDELLALYEQMLLIRRFEERAGQLYGLGLIGGFCHLYIGQEAVAVGLQSALTEGHRQRHHRLSRSRPHARLWHRPQGHHGRTDRARGRDQQGQGRLDAHVLDRAPLLRRARHRRRAGRARRRPRASRTSTAATAASASPISATARPTRARSTKRSTWPRCGSCRSSS